MLEHDTLARTVTKAGMILLENGAETNRVEDTMYRLCKAYGASVVDTYATPTLLIVSFTLNGQLVHNIKRIHIQSTNLSRIDAVNTLSRQACAGHAASWMKSWMKSRHTGHIPHLYVFWELPSVRSVLLCFLKAHCMMQSVLL